MNKFYINLKKVHSVGIGGIAFGLFLILALMILSYALFHNPHQTIHAQIFKTAENIRHYYRDRPSYWKLSTESAKDDRLIAEDLLRHKDFKLLIGQGENGDISMPNDISFDITLKNLNKSACINLSEFSIAKSEQLGLQRITIINDEGRTEFAWGEKNALPIKRYTTRHLCVPNGNIVLWTFQ